MSVEDSHPRTAIGSISAVTLATHDMARSFDFYTSLGFQLHYGGAEASFTSFAIGDGYWGGAGGDSSHFRRNAGGV